MSFSLFEVFLNFSKSKKIWQTNNKSRGPRADPNICSYCVKVLNERSHSYELNQSQTIKH